MGISRFLTSLEKFSDEIDVFINPKILGDINPFLEFGGGDELRGKEESAGQEQLSHSESMTKRARGAKRKFRLGKTTSSAKRNPYYGQHRGFSLQTPCTSL